MEKQKLLELEGKQIGIYKLTKFVKKECQKDKRKDKWKYKYYFEVECSICGAKFIKTLTSLQTSENLGIENCKICYRKTQKWEEAHKTMCEHAKVGQEITRRRNDEPNKNNKSTGIKHLYKKKKRGKRGEIKDFFAVKLMIDEKLYHVSSSYDFDKAKIIADEVNEILKTGGKEAFLDWYGKMKKETKQWQ